MAQPIIRGIQAVGSVSVTYEYNTADGILPVPPGFTGLGTGINTQNGVEVSGFRLDSEFIRAAQQIATSIVIPILGGGGLALTNNNRSGSFSIASSRVSTPTLEADGGDVGSMLVGNAVGPVGGETAYDIVLLSQIQQAATGGDSVGSTITVSFNFNGRGTSIAFQGCTVADVAPLAIAGNDASNYNVIYNYLNWEPTFSQNPIA